MVPFSVPCPDNPTQSFERALRKDGQLLNNSAGFMTKGSEYLTVKGKGQHGQSCFWTNLFDTWFERWPETAEDPGATQKVCIIV